MKTILKLTLAVMLACITNYTWAQTNSQNENKPIASVANKMGGSIEKKELIDAKKLIVKTIKADKTFQVSSFTMSRTGKGKDPVDIIAKSDEFTKDMLDVLEKSTAGDKIYFENIKIKNAKG